MTRHTETGAAKFMGGISSTRIWLIHPPQTHYSVETHGPLDSEWESIVLPAFQFWGGGSVWSAWHQQHASDYGMGFCVCCSPPLGSPQMIWEQKLGSESRARKDQYILLTEFIRGPNKESPSSKLLNSEVFSKCGTGMGNMLGTLPPSCLKHCRGAVSSIHRYPQHHWCFKAFTIIPAPQKPETIRWYVDFPFSLAL